MPVKAVYSTPTMKKMLMLLSAIGMVSVVNGSDLKNIDMPLRAAINRSLQDSVNAKLLVLPPIRQTLADGKVVSIIPTTIKLGAFDSADIDSVQTDRLFHSEQTTNGVFQYTYRVARFEGEACIGLPANPCLQKVAVVDGQINLKVGVLNSKVRIVEADNSRLIGIEIPSLNYERCIGKGCNRWAELSKELSHSFKEMHLFSDDAAPVY